jgi:stearoyl-CoA desaturase (delta-9 desaturase)
MLVYPPTWRLLLLALASYLLRMWAITVGYHRYFAHRSFRTSRAFRFVLAFMGASAMQNGPIWWASWHRAHHKYSDQPRDPHSPVMGGFWHAHLGWFFDGSHEVPDLSNVRDLTRIPELRFLEKFNWLPIAIYMLGCWLIAGTAGLLWGFVIPTVLALHATAAINSLRWGTRRFATKDDSRNNGWLAILTLGEGWHNNHHHDMSSARQGIMWWEIDVSYYTIKLLSLLRVVHHVRLPRAHRQGTTARTRAVAAAAT